MEENPYRKAATQRVDVASEAEVEERLAFIRRTYLHLLGAIFAFVGIEFALFQTGLAATFAKSILGFGQIIALALFIGTGWVARWLAMSGKPSPLQYVGLVLYVASFAVFFTPLLYVAVAYSDPTIIPTAAGITLSIFSLLTGYVFVTKQDFSFLGPFLGVVTLVALGVIVFSAVFGFQLGVFFAGAMVLLFAGYIVYDTSNILHHYRTDQHVAAALALFSSVAMMFYYVLMMLMGGE